MVMVDNVTRENINLWFEYLADGRDAYQVLRKKLADMGTKVSTYQIRAIRQNLKEIMEWHRKAHLKNCMLIKNSQKAGGSRS